MIPTLSRSGMYIVAKMAKVTYLLNEPKLYMEPHFPLAKGLLGLLGYPSLCRYKIERRYITNLPHPHYRCNLLQQNTLTSHCKQGPLHSDLLGI